MTQSTTNPGTSSCPWPRWASRTVGYANNLSGFRSLFHMNLPSTFGHRQGFFMLWIHCKWELGTDSRSLLCQSQYGERPPKCGNTLRSVWEHRTILCIRQHKQNILVKGWWKLRCLGKLHLTMMKWLKRSFRFSKGERCVFQEGDSASRIQHPSSETQKRIWVLWLWCCFGATE